PTVSLTSNIFGGELFQGANVTLSASVQSNDTNHPITSVIFYDVFEGEEHQIGVGALQSGTTDDGIWTSTWPAAGARIHTVIARATNSIADSATDSVRLTVLGALAFTTD